ncbi:hypothetical protein [Singulisphaera acidiphila]|uniref:SPOR domain-containing protein n=1 Tax=Singulisphaera acidiphila (strain ATCC BAA-1392 / DSM 18658 / VKM B-2454 / MOB10) TaxID=886293 RepID=L0D733_SINAD|nr:hypothetical protein [Singulisphaera acidiphila]AGA24685.1 hypothetical protein Sinac_0234 [Singulisphaera acidiphila DSM 18658]
MRKAIFAVMLVGASFAGGAVVNGPGLRWAQTMILSHLNGGDDNDNDEHDEAADSPATPKSTVGQEPLAPIPSDPIAPARAVVTAPASPEKDTAKPDPSRPEPAAAAIADAAAISADQRPQPAAPTLPKSDQDRRLGAETPEFTAAPAELKSSNDPEIALTNVPSPLPESHSTPLEPLDPLPPLDLTAPNATDKAKGQEPGWGDAPGSAPAAAVPPRSFGVADAISPPKPLTAPAPAPDKAKNASALAVAAPRPPSDWAEIRRRMAALGVSRYGIEGEPNGKVRFHCVIPLAGRRAVAQQFEAEGDDELQAAEVALRRVALWRATENPGP